MMNIYKTKAKMIGSMVETTPPSKVPTEIKKLLTDYREMSNITFEDIIDFHYRFEKIHPFQDDHVIIRTKLDKPSKIKGLALI